MNSFSKESKIEILNVNNKVDIPFLFALFLCCGDFDDSGNIFITSDLENLDLFLKKNLSRLYKKYGLENFNKDDIQQFNSFKIKNLNFYKIKFCNNILENLFDAININLEKSLRENLFIISHNDLFTKDFIKGMYVGCATSSIKISEKPNEKTNTGYHLEFSSKNLLLMKEFSQMISKFNILPKLITRKKNYVLYLKDSQQVCDLLALIGANGAVVSLVDEMVKRDFRNKINRQTNCLSGNITKTVDASIKQLDAIKKIDNKIGLENLPSDLYDVALMRLANPEEPLSTLLKLSNINLTKSGLNHRLKKIISIADKL